MYVICRWVISASSRESFPCACAIVEPVGSASRPVNRLGETRPELAQLVERGVVSLAAPEDSAIGEELLIPRLAAHADQHWADRAPLAPLVSELHVGAQPSRTVDDDVNAELLGQPERSSSARRIRRRA